MFYAVYEFNVPSANTEKFLEVWRELTLLIKNKSHGLGSHLHRCQNKPNVWIAYAQWPDRATWSQHNPLENAQQSVLVKKMQSLCLSIATVYELVMVEDLLD